MAAASYGPQPIPWLVLAAVLGVLLALPALRLAHPDPTKAMAPAWAGWATACGVAPLAFAWGGLLTLCPEVQPAAWGLVETLTALFLGSVVLQIIHARLRD